ncbi:hypothetical protein [Streptomyces taklimakanensis]|uniref:hypothetical protein n=1 Tax=Streptomyces taklimakanensis TaxID=2569853 RepID=UPI00192E5297|nr:hypothetical protein [Streptomyces taklimakanensis]
MGEANRNREQGEGERGREAERRTDPADRGPGAHSGGEARRGQRVVPGTASAAEGFSEGGTVEGQQLKGVEVEGTTTADTEEGDREVGPGEESHGRNTQGR